MNRQRILQISYRSAERPRHNLTKYFLIIFKTFAVSPFTEQAFVTVTASINWPILS